MAHYANDKEGEFKGKKKEATGFNKIRNGSINCSLYKNNNNSWEDKNKKMKIVKNKEEVAMEEAASKELLRWRRRKNKRSR